MNHKLSLAFALATLLCACGGGSNDDAPPATSFTTFVSALATSQSDSSAPVEINDTAFVISEDPHAFDSLFTP
jgi:hypothetical protein